MLLRLLSLVPLLCCCLSAPNFRVRDGKIFDPEGRLFSAAGLNLRDPSSANQVLLLFPSINFVRVSLHSAAFAAGPAAWDGFVKTMTARRVVSHMEHHPWPDPKAAYNGSNLTAESATYARWAAHYKNNP